MSKQTLSWTDAQSGKTYVINESYLNFYKKDNTNIKFKKFLGPSRIFNYIKDFHANLKPMQKFTFTNAFESFEDKSVSFKNALAENEKHIVVINESQARILTTDEIKTKFVEICQELLPSSLADLTLGQTGEDNPQYQQLKFIEVATPVDDSEISPAITFMVPLYAKSQTAADNFLKELTAKMHAAGYDFSSQEADDPFVQPFKEPIVILKLQFEAAKSSLHADFSNTTHLYHVSPSNNFKSIKAHGIIPSRSSSQFSYEPRVYFFNKTSMMDVIEYGHWKTIDSFVSHSPDLMFCIWKVDMKKLQALPEYKSGEMEFFKDALSTEDPYDAPDDTAVFTYSKIPTSVIDDHILIFKIDIDQQVKVRNMTVNTKKISDLTAVFKEL